jgi:hypothetical protein
VVNLVGSYGEQLLQTVQQQLWLLQYAVFARLPAMTPSQTAVSRVCSVSEQLPQEQTQPDCKATLRTCSARVLMPGLSAGPSMVNVLPLPVWPYAKMHTL